MNKKSVLLALLLVPALGACSDNGAQSSVNYHINGKLHVDFDKSGLLLSADGKPDAHIAADGALSIGDQPVSLTPDQRVLTQRFYAEAMHVRDDGIATGKAGAALAGHAVGTVIGDLFSGQSDKIDHDMDGQSKTVETAALHLCGDIQQLRDTQKEIGTRVAAFQPYAAFKGEVHCNA